MPENEDHKLENPEQNPKVKHRFDSLEGRIIDFLSVANGRISVDDVCKGISSQSVAKRDSVRKALFRLKEEGVIKKDGPVDGVYSKVESDAEEINIEGEAKPEFPLKLPLGLNPLVKVYHKNVIVVAGSPNSGKTAFLLNTTLENMYEQPVAYFSSEMGEDELKMRIHKFGLPIEDWTRNCKFMERATNFDDVIKPDIINIIDYLEIGDEFYRIGMDLQRIFAKLDKGVAIVAIQKGRDKPLGRGGDFTLEKPRLALSMDSGKVVIVKAKNWRTERNPNGLVLRFKLKQGCRFIVTQDWSEV